MAPIQEPEIQFAQRLASNEKPMRTKAIKKLRKYISVRSQKIKGGFEGDELLKLWKGLFYCLWMQDKPLLQEELSNQISGLLHNFQNVQSQFLFLETFLQTIKREWTGIDRLRMDKFFQLVRFVFKNTFEMMKRKEWETSVVTRFLELLTAQVLHSSSGAPCGLQFHILDIYMTELAAVGSAELTAAQNLTFIDPFCKTASKTRDRILLKAICSSIFSAIVDQAPFAIEDLLKEVKATGGGAEESDSGQASEEEDVKKELPKDKKAPKKTNGIVSTEEDDEDGLEDEDDDEMLHMESDSESEMPEDTEMGPVLQFDYSALADRLFGLASRSNTPSHNRQRLYKVIKTLRDLSEGVFPQDEYPEEVSTDEDDDEMFGSRKRMKRGRGFGDEEEEGSPAKKQKGKKNNSKAGKSDQTAATDDSKPVEIPGDANKKRKRKRKKTGAVKSEEQNGVEEGSEVKAEADTTPSSAPQTTDAKEAETEPSIPAKGTDTRKAFPGEKAEITAMETGVQSGTPQDVVVGNLSSVTVIEVDQKNQSEKPVPDATSSKKKKIKKSKTPAPEEEGYVAGPETNTDVVGPSVDTTKAGGRPAPATQDGEAAEGSSESALETATTTTTTSRRKISKQAAEEQTTIEEVEITSEIVDEATPPKTRRRRKTKRTAETDATPLDVVIPEDAEVAPASVATPTPLKKKKKKKKAAKAEEQTVEAKGETQLEADANLAEVEVVEVATPTPLKKKKKKSGRVAGEQEPDTMAEEQPTDAGLDTPVKNGKKKRKIPVVIEVASEVNGVAGNKKAKLGNDSEEPTTPVSAKKTKRMTPRKAKAGAESDFITFQTHATIPTPLFFKTAKGSPSTPLSSKKKKCRTPKSESKKVTFGLNKNKTAEFRKTDRSLLVSPEGSSRVPFDPQQKPLFGVLKSPEASLTNSTKKKTKGTPKRPTAADFF